MVPRIFALLYLFQISLAIDHDLFKLLNENVEKFEHELEDFKKYAKHYFKKEQECLLCKNLNQSEQIVVKEDDEFDFIIIGGGTSGSVLANRLSEIPEWKILLLEAGSPENEISEVPAMHSYLQNTPMNWGYKSTPQKSCCLGNIDNKCSLSSGKILGGTSSINSLIYTRGNHRDYDIWADKGLVGWCWKSVSPFFQKIEDSHLEYYDRKFHRQGGPLWIETYADKDEHFIKNILDSGHDLGLKFIDYNGKEQIGLSKPQVITKKGIRQSAAKAYLKPCEDRKNLIIRPLCHVTKILISHHTKEAYGVQYIHENKIFTAKATKEILLSAGALNSPKILLQSGIGPKDDLEKHSIPCISDIKVGHNLKDQFKFQGLNFIFNFTETDTDFKYDEVIEYLRHGDGPLTRIKESVIGYVKTEVARTVDEYPNIELIFEKNIYNIGYEQMRHTNIKEDLYNEIWKPLEDKFGFTILVNLLHPKSNGKISLFDKDPLRDPLIDINAFTDEDDEDIDNILSGIKYVLKFSQSEHFKKLGAHLNLPKISQCSHLEIPSDDYWKCTIKYLSFSLNRYTGTCKMGNKDDKFSVVDNLLKVHGINGLRVVDSSVIPVTISGDTMSPSLMIGENGANIIKSEWIR